MPKKYLDVISVLLLSQKSRYLLAGAWNTLFGYSSGLAIYYVFGGVIGLLWVAILSNILSISVAFLTYKLFVFKTSGNWMIEYIRAYFVYGISSVIGIICLLILVEWLGIAFWLAQGLTILVGVGFSYVGHKKFTFKNTNISWLNKQR